MTHLTNYLVQKTFQISLNRHVDYVQHYLFIKYSKVPNYWYFIGAQYSGIWAGWTDAPKEGIFVDMNDDNVTMQSVGVNLWRKSEPNGDLRENCVLLDGFEFTDMNCDKKYCGICDMAAAPVFKLRGWKDFRNFAFQIKDF